MSRLAVLVGTLVAAGPGVASAQSPSLATRLADIGPALSACWRPPPAFDGHERLEVTVRTALRRDGSLLGEPAVTYAAAPADSTLRTLLVRSAIAAVKACTPVALSPSLGAAIAGRIFSIRLIHQGRPGKGA